MKSELQFISFEHKNVLRNLMELCQHDYSEFSGEDVNEHGLFDYPYLDHYWTEAGRTPFFIRVSDKLAGFALIRELEEDQEEVTYSLAEFFILRKYRRKRIGEQAACQLFDRFQGRWKVKQEAENIPAQQFWRTVIARYTHGSFQEVEEADWNGPIQLFYTSTV